MKKINDNLSSTSKPSRYTIIFIGVVTCLFGISSCYYDVEETLYGHLTCETEDMSFKNDIQPILDNHCLSCHNAGSNLGNVNLTGFDQVKIYIDNGRLIGAITHMNGFSPMPQGNPKLSDCQISKFQAWIDQGLSNN